MKNFFIGLLIICSGLALNEFIFTKQEVLEVSVLNDVTDSNITSPTVEDITRIFSYGNRKWEGDVFRFSNISDVGLNHVSEIELVPANELLSNELERDKQILEFKSSIDSVLTAASRESIGRLHSSVYRPIARELEHLSQSESQKKILLVYSDLMENENGLSLYSKNILQTIEQNPELIKGVFEKDEPLPNLSGITVYFIFQPKDTIQDYQFKVMSQMYKSMLEEKGATVNIKANL